MSEPRTIFERFVPFVWCEDVTAAIAFYRDRLGFELEGHFHGDLPTGSPWAEAHLVRDDLKIHISTCNCEDKRHTGQAYFRLDVDDADRFHAECVEKGVPVLWGVRNQPWLRRDFTIEDPEGNRIEFSGPIPEDADDS